MPTARARHQVTETPAIEKALDVASAHWPGASRPELARRLIVAGAQAVEGTREEHAARRREAILASAGTGGHDYGPGYLQSLREDWPE